MNTIEQRVRIPVSPQIIWNYISNLANNAQWQVNCYNIAFITTMHQGRGARWRYGTGGGRDQVAEVTAWYNEVGYEYVIVDGSPFKSNIGRIKLHETAEGTVVHWTFEYELGGAFSGLRNTLTRRSLEDDMAESLWRLWETISKMDRAGGQFQARSLMRDAPDVEERAQYQPRHPSFPPSSATPERPVYGPPTGQFQRPAAPVQPTASIPEPPVADDDTRPNQAVGATTAPPSTPPSTPATALRNPGEPDFLSRIQSSAPALSQSPGSANFTFPTEAEVKQDEPFQFEAAQPPPTLTPPDTSVETAPSKPDTSTQLQQVDAVPSVSETPVTPPPPEPAAEAQPTYSLPTLEDEDEKIDTSKVSVFDLFGVQKPSETQEVPAVRETPPEEEPSESVIAASASTPEVADAPETVTPVAEPATPTPPAAEPPPPPEPAPLPAAAATPAPVLHPLPTVTPTEPGRIGLRVVLRRRRIKVRHPLAKQ